MEYESSSNDLFLKKKNQKSKNFPRNSLADFSQNVSLPHLAAKESPTVASTVEKDKGKGDW